MGSPFSMASGTSTNITSHVPELSLDSAGDFASECRQSLERAYDEGHTIDNAGIELKTLRMATNVPLARVADCVAEFLVVKIDLVETPAAQNAKVKGVIGRWGPLLTSIGWTDAVEAILMVQVSKSFAIRSRESTDGSSQRACAKNPSHQKLFGMVLASLYNADIVEYEDLKRWYAKVLGMKKQGLDPQDVLTGNMDNCMQQAFRLIQQIQAAEESDESEEEADEEGSDEDGKGRSKSTQADDDDEDEDEAGGDDETESD